MVLEDLVSWIMESNVGINGTLQKKKKKRSSFEWQEEQTSQPWYVRMGKDWSFNSTAGEKKKTKWSFYALKVLILELWETWNWEIYTKVVHKFVVSWKPWCKKSALLQNLFDSWAFPILHASSK